MISSTICMPLPPPPAAAFTITGKPISRAMRSTSSGSSGKAPSEPGTVGTPTFIINGEVHQFANMNSAEKVTAALDAALEAAGE